MKNLITYLLFLLLSVATVSAQPSGVQPAFRAGERLTLKVSYRAKLIPNTEVATVVMSVADTTLNDKPHYVIYGNGRTLPSWRWFYNLDDTYRSYVDTTTFRPILATSRIRENGYRAWSRFEYDWGKGNCVSLKQRRQDPVIERHIPIAGESYDGVSLFYDLRTIDPATLVENEEHTLALLLSDTVRYINYRFLGRENKRVRGVGTFRTLKFTCQLATSTGESFEDGSEFFIWISDDRNKIPIFFESPIRVGSVRAYISSYEGLRYPLESKVD
ncbi:MAG: DUF3108 domain-containing protein [Rikenellaceae bacterium]|jgi:hypothetical protein|nr:DUF3108 domain-containing protein [Rikenellaceae bacterium]